ncbi:MAG: hypothetical protein ACFCUW_09745 [Kiloniellaceae bacterium]
MFVYYLDGCLTAYWQLFVLSLWLVSLLFIAYHGRRLLRARDALASLKAANITGAAYDRMKPNPGRNLRWLLVGCVVSAAILLGYAEFFSTFRCTPDSILWWVPENGLPPS